MPKPDPIETILARLMPVALSDEGQRGMEAMLDELAGPLLEIRPAKPWFRKPLAAGLAAAGIAAALVLQWAVMPSPHSQPAVATAHAPTPGVVLVGESGSIKSMSAEGWQENPDGSAMRTLRMKVVEENQLLDEETGIVMLVSEPREEFLMVPVSAF